MTFQQGHILDFHDSLLLHIGLCKIFSAEFSPYPSPHLSTIAQAKKKNKATHASHANRQFQRWREDDYIEKNMAARSCHGCLVFRVNVSETRPFFDSHYGSLWTSKMNYIDSMFPSSWFILIHVYLSTYPYIYHVHDIVYTIYIHLNIYVINMYTVGISLIPLNFTLQSCFHFRNFYLTSQQNPKRVATRRVILSVEVLCRLHPGQNTPSSIAEFSISIPLEKEGQ